MLTRIGVLRLRGERPGARRVRTARLRAPVRQQRERWSETCGGLSGGEPAVLSRVLGLPGNGVTEFGISRRGTACRGFRGADSERACGMGRHRGLELYRAPFPLYALRVDPKTGLLIAAGGGGAAKTGIKNGVVRTQGYWELVMPWSREIPGWPGGGGGMQGWNVPLL